MHFASATKNKDLWSALRILTTRPMVPSCPGAGVERQLAWSMNVDLVLVFNVEVLSFLWR